VDEACEEWEEYAQEGDDVVVHACFLLFAVEGAAWQGNYMFTRGIAWTQCDGDGGGGGCVILGSSWWY
jgi:hypothetical protein